MQKFFVEKYKGTSNAILARHLRKNLAKLNIFKLCLKRICTHRAHQDKNVTDQASAVIFHHFRISHHHDLDEIFTR